MFHPFIVKAVSDNWTESPESLKEYVEVVINNVALTTGKEQLRTVLSIGKSSLSPL